MLSSALVVLLSSTPQVIAVLAAPVAISTRPSLQDAPCKLHSTLTTKQANNKYSVTSVGATQLSGTSSETAASFSTGGFSNYFGTPSWQASAVKSYLSSIGSANNGKYNASGRAFPDVAAIGTSVQIVVNGQVQNVDGTSCSSPIFASIIALINDNLLMHGKSSLGLLNPLLYANPTAFRDITSGEYRPCYLAPERSKLIIVVQR